MSSRKPVTVYPSKSFPGNYYYFDFHTGKAFWCRDASENTGDQSHSSSPERPPPPEPTSPPTFSFGQMRHPTAVFGRSTFPTPLLGHNANIIWTPIQIQVPFLVSNGSTSTGTFADISQQLTEPPEPQMASQSPSVDSTPYRSLLVESCNLSTSMHFSNFESPSVNFTNNNKENIKQLKLMYSNSTPIKTKLADPRLIPRQPFKPKTCPSFADLKTVKSFDTGTSKMSDATKSSEIINTSKLSYTNAKIDSQSSKMSETSKLMTSTANPFIREPVFKRTQNNEGFTSLSEPTVFTESPRKVTEQCVNNLRANIPELTPEVSNILDDSTINLESQRAEPSNSNNHETTEKVNQEAVNRSGKKGSKEARILKPCIISNIVDNSDFASQLSDLRQRLALKRKREALAEKDETPNKKRVTFNLEQEDMPCNDDDDDEVGCVFIETHRPTLKQLKELKQVGCGDEIWYLLPDTDVLLSEFTFLNQFVQIDPACAILVESSVHSEVSSLARGGARGRALAARHVLRRLNADHLTVQDCIELDAATCKKDAILKCCLQIMDKHHVVIISNDIEVHTTAKCHSVPCYTINFIKNGLATKPVHIKHNIKMTVYAENGSASTKIDDSELNEREKEIIRENKKSNQKFVSMEVEKNKQYSNKNVYSRESLRIAHAIDLDNKNSKDPNDEIMSVENKPKIQISFQNKVFSFGNNDKPKMVTQEPLHKILLNKDANFDGKEKQKYNKEKETDNNIENDNIPLSTGINSNMVSNIDNTERYQTNTVSSPFIRKNSNQYQIPTPIRKSNISSESMAPESDRKFKMAAEDVIKTKMASPVVKNHPSVSDPGNNELDIINLTEFCVKSKFMEDNLNFRMDEWRCTYMQILEEALTNVLEKQPRIALKLAPPYNLRDALNCLKILFKENGEIIKYIGKLGSYLYDYRIKDDKNLLKKTISPDVLKKVIAPEAFMKALGCGIRLLESLQKVVSSVEIQDGHSALQELVKQIENDNDCCELIELPSKRIKAPDNKGDQLPRHNFVKNNSEITEYLKRHFEDWKEYENNPTDLARNLALSDKNVDIDNIYSKQTEFNGHLRNGNGVTLNDDDTETVCYNQAPLNAETGLDKANIINKSISKEPKLSGKVVSSVFKRNNKRLSLIHKPNKLKPLRNNKTNKNYDKMDTNKLLKEKFVNDTRRKMYFPEKDYKLMTSPIVVLDSNSIQQYQEKMKMKTRKVRTKREAQRPKTDSGIIKKTIKNNDKYNQSTHKDANNDFGHDNENNDANAGNGLKYEQGWLSVLESHNMKLGDILAMLKDKMKDNLEELNSASEEIKRTCRYRALEMDNTLGGIMSRLRVLLRKDEGRGTDAVLKYIELAKAAHKINATILDSTKELNSA